MKKLISIATGISLISGCANQPAEVLPSEPKFSITQSGRGQNTNYVFCEEGKCAERTSKVVAAPPAPKVHKPVAVTAPAPEKYTVHFRWACANLDKAGEKELGTVVARVAGKPIKRIEVAGRTDPTGSYAYNKKLAKRRAETVKSALVKAGIPVGVIHTSIQKPCCDGDLNASKKTMQQLRRTDIEITITTNE